MKMAYAFIAVVATILLVLGIQAIGRRPARISLETFNQLLESGQISSGRIYYPSKSGSNAVSGLYVDSEKKSRQFMLSFRLDPEIEKRLLDRGFVAVESTPPMTVIRGVVKQLCNASTQATNSIPAATPPSGTNRSERP